MRFGQEGSSQQAELARMGYEGWMIRVKVFLAALAALLVSGAAVAGPRQSIQYSYYPVIGGSPAEIYRGILDRGPRVNGEQAIAATNSDVIQNYNLVQGKSACQVTDYQLTLHFKVILPQLTGTKTISPSDTFLWQQFTVFLRAHELRHTKLWLGCAADLQRKVEAISALNCKDAEQQAQALWRSMKASCDKLQTSFDREQRSELAAQPFMQRVIRGR
jgi:predicted secreted Zn-dependent protease